MKITIETTDSLPRRVITVEVASDDLSIWEAMEAIVGPALIGYGYAAETVEALAKGVKP